MLKYFIIFLIILLVIDLILFINVEARIIKKNNEPMLLKIRLLNQTILNMRLQNNKKDNNSFKFKLSYIFESDLNLILKDLKEENFFVYLILEHGIIQKVTVIPTFNSSNPLILPYLGVMDWMIASTIKRYIDSTFKVVNDDYYQIILLKEESQSLNFEIYITTTLFWVVISIFKKFKVFLKLFKKKEQTYE